MICSLRGTPGTESTELGSGRQPSNRSITCLTVTLVPSPTTGTRVLARGSGAGTEPAGPLWSGMHPVRRRMQPDTMSRRDGRIRRLPVPVIAAIGTTMRAHDDHSRSAVVARFDDDDAGWAVAVVIRMRVSEVIRLANHDLSTEVRITKTQRDADPCLGLREAGSKTEQQSNGNEYAFHCPSWMHPS